MDFVGELPPSRGSKDRQKDPYNAILVVVDRFSKMARFIPCWTNVTAVEFAHLMFSHIFTKLGAPRTIVSDRGNLFRSAYWQTLSKLMGTDSRLSTAFRPQTDGQTERLNSSLEQLLRAYVSTQQHDWADWLGHAEFAYNSMENASTKVSPFFAVFSRVPRHPLIGDWIARSERWPAAHEAAERIEKISTFVRENIVEAQARQKRYYDQGHKDIQFAVGDWVMLNARHIKTSRPSKKFDDKCLGPFEIVDKIGTHAYRLDLPSSFEIHDVFHCSLLEPYHKNMIEGRHQPPPPAVDGVANYLDEEHFEVEKVLESRRRRNKVQYRLQWTGYQQPDYVWRNWSDLDGCQELIREFHEEHPNAARHRLA